MKMLEESFTLPPDPLDKAELYPLYITAKKYYMKDLQVGIGSDGDLDMDAVTILALHSTSFHKETWEPTIAALFESVITAGFNGKGKVRIREVWTIDCPNHGYSGLLNREVLKGSEEFVNNFSCGHYARAIHRFFMNAPTEFGVDFRKRRLIGLGHSLGANALLLLQGIQPLFPFKSFIIVEPMISPGGAHLLDDLRVRLVEGAKRRSFEWPDKDKAYLALKSNPRTARWDERVVKAFVKHAIGTYPPSNNVSLACTREQEETMYLDLEGATKPAEELTRLCQIFPVHLILGVKKDFLPGKVHQILIDPKSGRRYATFTEIPEVGHLIPQEIPDKLGALIYELLGRPAKL